MACALRGKKAISQAQVAQGLKSAINHGTGDKLISFNFTKRLHSDQYTWESAIYESKRMPTMTYFCVWCIWFEYGCP